LKAYIVVDSRNCVVSDSGQVLPGTMMTSLLAWADREADLHDCSTP
jgi:hypothetical protein